MGYVSFREGTTINLPTLHLLLSTVFFRSLGSGDKKSQLTRRAGHNSHVSFAVLVVVSIGTLDLFQWKRKMFEKKLVFPTVLRAQDGW